MPSVFEKKRLEMNVKFSKEEADIFHRSHFPRTTERWLEIQEEEKEKICSFYAYGMDCPDMIEF